jgi:glucosyl-3-phosphoglycerate phosphatase
MRLFLVRHGETEWNAERRLQGQADAPLSALGRRQASALAPVFANGLLPDFVVSSDLPRARDTAALLGFAEPQFDARLREIDVGAWTGKRIVDIRADNLVAYQGWRAGTFTPSGGEPWPAFKDRVLQAIRDLAALGHNSVLAVAHGGVIRAACEALVGLKAANVVPVGPATVTIFDVEATADGLSARLEGYNLAPQTPILAAPD